MASLRAQRKMSLHIFDRSLALTCYLQVVAGVAAAWVASGVIVGLVLSLAISMVLVHAVNPQSFHWSAEG